VYVIMKNFLTFQTLLKRYFIVWCEKGEDPDPWDQTISYPGGSGTETLISRRKKNHKTRPSQPPSKAPKLKSTWDYGRACRIWSDRAAPWRRRRHQGSRVTPSDRRIWKGYLPCIQNTFNENIGLVSISVWDPDPHGSSLKWQTGSWSRIRIQI